MPYAKTSQRGEQRALREQMRALGMSHRQIAVEFARRYNLRPRAAWRHAHGWSLKEAAEGINTYAAYHGLHPDGATVAMTGPHLCEHEGWPGHGSRPTGRRPTPYLLSLLAAVYGCNVHDLLDAADYQHLPPADRLILDKAMSASRASDHGPAPARSAVVGRAGGPPQAGPGSPVLFGTAARSAPPAAVVFSMAADGLTPDDEERIAFGLRDPRRLDAETIDALSVVLAAQRKLEDRIGSAPMLGPVAAQVTAAGRLAAAAPAALRPRVLDVAAQYGYFEGWLYESTGQLQHALRNYDRALAQAAEAGDVNLISELLSMKGHIAWAQGDPGEVVRLSQAAQRDPAAHPGQHAISALQEARALAVLGDARAVSRKLADADRAESTASGRTGDRPPWLYYHSAGFLVIQRGRIWMHLGAHDASSNKKAVEALTVGVATLETPARQSEWGASYLLHLARAHMQAGDADQACAAVCAAVAVARQLESAALLARIRRLHARLAARWSALPAVTELTQRLR